MPFLACRIHSLNVLSKSNARDCFLFFFLLSVANIRRHLAAAVPQSDQILLLGPPYKVPKDSTLQSEEVLNSLRLGDLEDDPSASATKSILSTTERTGARRLFLFSKQALSENAPDPPPCQLEPMTLTLPNEPGPSPLPPSQSPLHQALEVYERRFMLHLCQGRVLADGADMRLSSCRTCVLEQAVMARALRAAVSNLSVHLNGTLRTRSDLTSAFQTKTSGHAALLQRFESILSSLDGIPLHPALVSVARSQGRVMETLLDTVPVERERAWANQCQTSHQRLMAMFGELNAAFAQLGTTASREEEAKQDLMAENEIKDLWNQVEGAGKEIRDRQAERLGKLTTDHGEVVKVIMHAINTGGGAAQAAFATLEEMSTASSEILPSMQSDDAVMLELMKRIADSKTRAMKRMKGRLREVSLAQSSIQRVNSSVVVLRDALAQQCENMVHLEHVAELPNSYRDFLSELRRRRAYGGAVTSTSAAMLERLASMRDDEVKAREKFLRGSGRHLMPTFFEIFAPTLATPPPLFTPQLPSMNELETLPDVGTSGSTSDAQMQGNASADVPTSGVSSASSLTAVSQAPPQPGEQEAEPMMATGTIPEEGELHDHLIVSADEHSGHDLIVEPSGGTAADAERKTLAYENAVLRQALERMGGKPPRTYVDEARAAEQTGGTQKQDNDGEVALLRNQLQDAKEQLQKANEALVEAKKQDPKESDKISHSSFDVGDIGLFMLTGRGPAGKRTYLAFHTNCPHRYLSTDCIKGTPDCVLGRIIYQEELVAGEKGTDANPYGLRVGTKFWVLTVEVISTL